MGKRVDTRLSEEDRQPLEQVIRKSLDWRARSKTFLLLWQPLLNRVVTMVQNLNSETVSVTWQRWVKEGMDALFYKPRIEHQPS